jgi:hypothetical protein
LLGVAGNETHAVVTSEAIALAQRTGGGKDIRGDYFFQQAWEFAVGEADAVESLEFFAEILLQRLAITDIRAIDVLQAFKLIDQFVFKLAFGDFHRDRCSIS